MEPVHKGLIHVLLTATFLHQGHLCASLQQDLGRRKRFEGQPENSLASWPSKIRMKGCIKVLKDQPPNSVEGLLNALRYLTSPLVLSTIAAFGVHNKTFER
ncbi:hypothetical protein L345_15649, partial [Ophiophagus hannah]